MPTIRISNKNISTDELIGPGMGYGKIPSGAEHLKIKVAFSISDFLDRFSNYYDQYIENEKEAEEDDFEDIPEFLELKNIGYLPLIETVKKEPKFLAKFIKLNLSSVLLDYLFPAKSESKEVHKYCFIRLDELSFQGEDVHLEGIAISRYRDIKGWK